MGPTRILFFILFAITASVGLAIFPFGFFKNTTTPIILTDTWTTMSTTNAPIARTGGSEIWTGTKLISWGGGRTTGLATTTYYDTGAIWDRATDTWATISTTNAPSARTNHVSVWTGSKLIVWGGVAGTSTFRGDGKIYDLATDTWTDVSAAGAPSARNPNRSYFWTGNKIIVWGGSDGSGNLNDGAVYDVATDSWSTISNTNAPAKRSGSIIVWTGSNLIVWGGYDGSAYLNSGAMYNLATDTWTAISGINALSARSGSNFQWTGSEIVIWGGAIAGPTYLADGARFNPSSNTWTGIDMTNGPTASHNGAKSIWTGSKILMWGGQDTSFNYSDEGFIYDVATNSWSAMSTSGTPSAKSGYTLIWTGTEMIVWGGQSGPICVSAPCSFTAHNDGGVYNLASNTWSATSTTNTPFGGFPHVGIWTGEELIIWGGSRSDNNNIYTPIYFNSGATYK